MKISDLLNEDSVKVNLKGSSKTEIIKELVDLIGHSDSVLNNKEVLNSIVEREKAVSTGIGNGVAIPHGKCSYVKNLIGSFGTLKDGIPFDAIDGKPVYIIFMLVTPPGPAYLHIKALSLVSRILNDGEAREKFLKCNTPKEVFSVFENEEKKYI